MDLNATAFEYAMGLFSVLIGLAVVDIATSFHHLMRHRHEVRWDPLTLSTAVYALCIAVYMWFDIWGVRRFAATRHFPFYLGLVAMFFILYLAAAASLPDEAGNSRDLREYYAKNRPYFWSLITLFQLAYTVFGIYFTREDIARMPTWSGILLFAQMSAPVPISVILLFFRPRALHYIGVALLFGVMVFHYSIAQIN